MTLGVECQNLIKPRSRTYKIISLFLFIFAGTTSSQNISQNIQCPFQYVYHFGDGAQDIGNSIRLLPSLPAARLPYGQSFPTGPTGRWTNGFTDVDYTAADLGKTNIIPYLAVNESASNDGVIFSVANSTVLDREFFSSRNITIAPYATSLSLQLSWFQDYIRLVCPNSTDCARLNSSIIIFSNIEANDFGYALVQGKSIQEARTYVPQIAQTVMDTGRELIRMGATRVAFTGSAPLGCFPYILTALPSENPSDYDELGCLRSVNDLVVSQNNAIQRAVFNLIIEYPNVTIIYGDYYTLARLVIVESSTLNIGPGGNRALKSCCGVGGKYNFDFNRPCGSAGVPVCSTPDSFTFWDGVHFTQEAYRRIERYLVRPLLPVVKCI